MDWKKHGTWTWRREDKWEPCSFSTQKVSAGHQEGPLLLPIVYGLTYLVAGLQPACSHSQSCRIPTFSFSLSGQVPFSSVSKGPLQLTHPFTIEVRGSEEIIQSAVQPPRFWLSLPGSCSSLLPLLHILYFLNCLPCGLQAPAPHTEATAIYKLPNQLSQLHKVRYTKSWLIIYISYQF